MRYNRTRLRKPHKCRVFADFVQTKTQGIRRQIDQIHRKGRFAIRIQRDSVSENCHRGPGHSDYRPGFLFTKETGISRKVMEDIRIWFLP